MTADVGSELCVVVILSVEVDMGKRALTAARPSAYSRHAAARTTCAASTGSGRANHDFVTFLQLTVERLDDFGNGVVGDADLDLHRLDRFVGHELPNDSNVRRTLSAAHATTGGGTALSHLASATTLAAGTTAGRSSLTFTTGASDSLGAWCSAALWGRLLAACGCAS